jgi:hypothetical protein
VCYLPRDREVLVDLLRLEEAIYVLLDLVLEILLYALSSCRKCRWHATNLVEDDVLPVSLLQLQPHSPVLAPEALKAVKIWPEYKRTKSDLVEDEDLVMQSILPDASGKDEVSRPVLRTLMKDVMGSLQAISPRERLELHGP